MVWNFRAGAFAEKNLKGGERTAENRLGKNVQTAKIQNRAAIRRLYKEEKQKIKNSGIS